ncbi:MAG: peptidylprolyl isomerase [Verrucomicrobiales bacterium]|nr:peptidylprolyl isomerase [Verrucomicrobiales bacterium]
MSLRINGEEIDDELIEAEFRQVKGHYERTLQVSCCERDPEFLGYAKDNIISRALLNQASRQRVPEVEESEIDERLNRLIKEAGGEQQFCMNTGIPSTTHPAVRDNVAQGVRLDRMLGQVYAPEPEPTEDELRAWHQEHAEQFMSADEVNAAHITLSLSGASSRAEVYERLRALRRQLLDGADFLTLAEENRSDEQQQIDLGWFKQGEFMEEFETIVFSMNIGEISPVFMTQLGYHICTVLGRRPPALMPFDEVRDAVRQRLIDVHRDTRFTAFLEELKAAAQIEDSDPENLSQGCGH